MICTKTGFTIIYVVGADPEHIYQGDKYSCGSCNNETFHVPDNQDGFASWENGFDDYLFNLLASDDRKEGQDYALIQLQ